MFLEPDRPVEPIMSLKTQRFQKFLHIFFLMELVYAYTKLNEHWLSTHIFVDFHFCSVTLNLVNSNVEMKVRDGSWELKI